jgi:hypothetical protein
MAMLRAHPIWAAVLVGAVCRLVSAVTSYGWFAPDDLGLAIEQGHAWVQDPDAPMQDSIRSPILSWVFWLLMSTAHALGIVDPAHVLRFAYSCLGLYSLAAIPAAYALARPALGAHTAAMAAWLVSVYALMPHISTRGLIEVIAIVPLLWALVATEYASRAAGVKHRLIGAFVAGLGLGAASLIRFQLGLLFAPACARLAMSTREPQAVRQTPLRARAMDVMALCAGGAVMALVQLAMDLHMQRGPFGTLRAYMHFNVHYSQGLGTSAWYTYLGEFALLILPPAGLWLLVGMWRAGKAHPLVASCLVFFVGVHSAIGHKEDRFMFTVLPLLLVLLADALVSARQASRPARRAYAGFWVLNTVALIAAMTSDAHRNVTDPLLYLSRTPQTKRVCAVGFTVPALPRYYMGSKTELRHVESVTQLAQSSEAHSDWQPHYILLRHLPDDAARTQLSSLSGLQCAEAQTFGGDWVDRLLVRVNRHNRLRAPTSLWVCQSKTQALSQAPRLGAPRD